METTMKSCDHFQAQMLEHLYGLLDGDDSRALAEHLSQCADCRAASARAEVQKKLLAAAAKAEFAGVRFQAPAPETAAPAEQPRVLTVRSRGSWVRWAVAASVLLLLGGLGVPTGIYWHQQERVAQADAVLDQIEKDRKAVEAKYNDNLAQAHRELAALQADVAKVAQQ